jgi:hypothetical protein
VHVVDVGLVEQDLRVTARTNFSTAAAPCAVPVGLLGLQKNTRPAPLAAAVMPSMSRPYERSTWITLTGTPIRRAVPSQVAKVGAAVTSGLSMVQKARVAPSRIGPEPVPTMTWSRSTPNVWAIVADRSPT